MATHSKAYFLRQFRDSVPEGSGYQAAFAAFRKKYRALAIQWHPDKNPGDVDAEDNFKNLQAVYEDITDTDHFNAFRKNPADYIGSWGDAALEAGAGKGTDVNELPFWTLALVLFRKLVIFCFGEEWCADKDVHEAIYKAMNFSLLAKRKLINPFKWLLFLGLLSSLTLWLSFYLLERAVQKLLVLVGCAALFPVIFLLFGIFNLLLGPSENDQSIEEVFEECKKDFFEFINAASLRHFFKEPEAYLLLSLCAFGCMLAGLAFVPYAAHIMLGALLLTYMLPVICSPITYGIRPLQRFCSRYPYWAGLIFVGALITAFVLASILTGGLASGAFAFLQPAMTAVFHMMTGLYAFVSPAFTIIGAGSAIIGGVLLLIFAQFIDSEAVSAGTISSDTMEKILPVSMAFLFIGLLFTAPSFPLALTYFCLGVVSVLWLERSISIYFDRARLPAEQAAQPEQTTAFSAEFFDTDPSKAPMPAKAQESFAYAFQSFFGIYEPNLSEETEEQPLNTATGSELSSSTATGGRIPTDADFGLD